MITTPYTEIQKQKIAVIGKFYKSLSLKGWTALGPYMQLDAKDDSVSAKAFEIRLGKIVKAIGLK